MGQGLLTGLLEHRHNPVKVKITTSEVTKRVKCISDKRKWVGSPGTKELHKVIYFLVFVSVFQ